MLKPLFLKVFYQGRLLKIQPFTEEQISVGGGEGLSLVLQGLAPWHILIEKKGADYIIFDLGSEIGTLLNGQRVMGECKLSSGSLITLGEYQIQFFIGPPPPGRPHPAPAGNVPRPAAPSAEDRVSAQPVQEPPSPRPARQSPPAPSAASGSDPHYVERPPHGPAKGPESFQGHAVPSSPPKTAPYSAPNESFQKPSTPTAAPSYPEEAPATQRSMRPPSRPQAYPSPGKPQSAPAGNVPRPASPSAEDRFSAQPPSGPPSPPPLKRAVGYSGNIPFPNPAVSPVPSPEKITPQPESALSPRKEPQSPQPHQQQPIEDKASLSIPTPPSEEKKRPLFSFKSTAAPKKAQPEQDQPDEQPPPGDSSPPLEESFVSGSEGSALSASVGDFQKPDKKGFWRTFAPAGKIKSLDEYLTPSIGNFIEVIVAWKERILSSYHFSKGPVYMGSGSGCDVPVTNLSGLGKYKLLDIQGTAQVFFQGVTGALIQGKEKSTRTVHSITGNQSVVLKPYEMIRLDFKNTLKVYVRIKNKPASVVSGRIFHFSLAEISVLFFSFLLTGLLVFYSGFYAPLFLLEDEKFVEENIQKAVVKFTKPPRVPPPVRDYQLKKKTQRAKVKASAVKKKSFPRKKTKRASIPSKIKPKKTKKKKWGLKALGRKKGKSSASTRGKKKSKVAVGSIRPGGSLKTGKAGATAKTVAPDPTKMGLLGVFGKGGKLKNLDQGATGSAEGGLVGLAEGATGFAGTRESYGGEGVGTRTKEMVSGGRGSALVGISGIKVKGRGGSLKGAGAGGLGTRGRMSINIGTDDIDVEGSIDRDAILRVIFKNHRRFDHCYQAGLQGDDSLQGNLKMQWQILSNGRVRGVRALQDGVGSRSLAGCVANVLKGLKFPIPPSGQIPRISFKFVFSK